MTCTTTQIGGTVVTICRSGNNYRRRILRCPIDECMTEVVVSYPSSPYYGPRCMCTKCGEWWAEGELAPRPFARGWRRKQQAEHRALWAEATYGPGPDYREYFETEETTR